VDDSAPRTVRHYRRRKHRLRRFARIFLGAGLVIGLFFLVLSLRRNSPPANPTIPDGDSPVQFK
jgi:hypothetical protein